MTGAVTTYVVVARGKLHPVTESSDDGRSRRTWPDVALSITARIADGTYALGARIPSLRKTAAEHGVAQKTVKLAMDDLVAKGVLEARRGSGYYVKRVPQPFHDGSPSGDAAQLADHDRRLADHDAELADLRARLERLERGERGE